MKKLILIFALAAGRTETFTVYFRGTFDSELRKSNRKALTADSVKILPASKSDFGREYFSFYKYIDDEECNSSAQVLEANGTRLLP